VKAFVGVLNLLMLVSLIYAFNKAMHTAKPLAERGAQVLSITR
jgi:putative flippase GtrA